MSGYSKLDCGIVDSSLWEMPHEYLRVWIAMLAKTDATGYVRVAAPAMARLCHLTREDFDRIIDVYCSPDPESRTSDHDGRRLEKVEGGWQILNYAKYREGLKQPDSSAGRMRKLREKRKCDGFAVTVTVGDAYAEAEAEAEAIKNLSDSCPTTPDGDGQQSDSLKSKKQDLLDPLGKLPALSKAYDAIHGRIKVVHPRAKIPAAGTEADFEARRCLERLVRLDGHSEQEVLDTLRWVLYTEPEGDFTWRAQFHSIANLRQVKGGMSKFAKMLEAMKRFQKQAARAKIDPDEPLHHREAREKGILP